MNAVFHNRGKQGLVVLVITLVWSALLFSSPAWGIEPGVSLKISTPDKEQDPTFILGSPVKLVMIIKNDTNFPVNTERGFSKLEPQRFLVLIDPQGTYHVVGGTVTSGDAPPPFFLGDKTAVPAESIPAMWNKKVTIEDLSKLFPVINKSIGWYKLEAHMPFVRLVWTLQNTQLGLLGIADDTRNFVGTVDADQVQFHVVLAPAALGAHIRVRLLDQSTEPPTPINQAPVRVYEQTGIEGLTLEEAWAKGSDLADLNGLTSPEGWATWSQDLCELQNDYKAIAFYQDEYKEVLFSKDQDAWAEQCDGNIEKTIYFGEEPGPPPMVVGRFSVFGLDSVEIGKHAVVLSGDIGVNAARAKPRLKSSFGVNVRQSAELEEGVGIYADSVRIEKDAVVYDVYYNELENNGQILGEMITPLALPVWEPPAFLESVPGKKDIKVKGKNHKMDKKDKKDDRVVELAAGAYDKVEIDDNGELHLLGGTYHFSSMKIEQHASLIFLGPATILVAEDLEGDDEVYIGPDANSGISAADIVFYIGGIEEKNGKKKNPIPKVKKVAIGKKSKVIANIYAPNSTLEIQRESMVEGSFIARDVIVDDKSTVEYNSAF